MTQPPAETIRRNPVARIAALLSRPVGEPATWRCSRRLFLVAIGLVFAIAFLSFWVQAELLVGEQGLLPMSVLFAEAADSDVGFFELPTLFWLSHGSVVLHGVCAVGLAAGVLLMLGIAPRWALLICWVGYLSLFQVTGGLFLAFPADWLLLEAGLLAMLVTPGGLLPRERWRCAPPRPARWLLWWLLFRVVFFAGEAKLSGGETAWASLDAVQYYYWTQPLPTASALHCYYLPDWFHALVMVLVIAAEMLLPWLALGSRRLRKVAFLGLLLVQLCILATGNHGLVNLLVIALCLLLLDDQTLAPLLPRRLRCPSPEDAPRGAVARFAVPAVAALLFLASLLPLLPDAGDQGTVGRSLAFARRIGLGHSYESLADVPTARPELVIQGSENGESWHPYEMRWKPGLASRAPELTWFYVPRVDRQMAYVVWDLTEGAQIPTWLRRVMVGILQENEVVEGLFVGNPFPDEPPRYVRLALYHYSPADPEAFRGSGLWWHREFLGATEVVERSR